MSINHFFGELAKMEFETPMSTKITIYIAILVVVLILYFIFGNTNMIDLLKDNYNYYFSLVIINLVNKGWIICLTLIFYVSFLTLLSLFLHNVRKVEQSKD